MYMYVVPKSNGLTKHAQTHEGGSHHAIFKPTLVLATQRRLAQAHHRLAPEAPEASRIPPRGNAVGQYMHGGVMLGDDAPTPAVVTALGKPVPCWEQRATGKNDISDLFVSEPERAVGKEGVEQGQ